MAISRRDFIKNNAVIAAASAAGITLPAETLLAKEKNDDGIRWDKAPCRFCGTGCSVLVGCKDGRVIGTQGDPEAPVNKGLNCIKGYFLSKILYGGDRLKTPLLRKTNGKFDKNGKFEPVSWDEALDHTARRLLSIRAEDGPKAFYGIASGRAPGEGAYLLQKFTRTVMGSNFIDNCSRA